MCVERAYPVDTGSGTRAWRHRKRGGGDTHTQTGRDIERWKGGGGGTGGDTQLWPQPTCTQYEQDEKGKHYQQEEGDVRGLGGGRDIGVGVGVGSEVDCN